MQVDAVHVGGGQQTPGGHGNGQPDKGKGGKGKGTNGGKGREKEETQFGKFEGECRNCKKKRHKKDECRNVQADLAAGRYDKNDQGRQSASHTSDHCAERGRVLGKHCSCPTSGPCLLPKSHRQSDVTAARNLVHQHD